MENISIVELKSSIEGLLKTQHQANTERLELLEKSTSKRFDSLDQLKLDKVAEAQASSIKEMEEIRRQLAVANAPKLEVEEKTSKILEGYIQETRERMARGVEEKFSIGSYLKKNLEQKDFSNAFDSEGGFLTPNMTLDPVFGDIREVSQIRNVATVQYGTTPGISVPQVYDRTAIVNRSEVGISSTYNTSNSFQLGDIVAGVYETNILLSANFFEDVQSSILSAIKASVLAEITRKEGIDAVVGGIYGNNGLKGILSYASGTTPANGQIQRVNSGSSGAFTYNGLIDLMTALKPQYRRNGTLALSSASFGSILKIVDSQSRPIFVSPLSAVGFQQFLGGNTKSFIDGAVQTEVGMANVIFFEDLPALASGSNSAIYGDFSKYVVYDRRGVNIITDIYTSKGNVVMYFSKRTGGAVVDTAAFKIQQLS